MTDASLTVVLPGGQRIDCAEHFCIRGDVGAGVFAGWIDRHAARLGLRARVLSQRADCVEVQVSGAPELLDAMEMGCLLGPREVWVDEIVRVPGNWPSAPETSSAIA